MELPGQLEIPEFKSLTEFRQWWESLPVVQFRQTQPGHYAQITNHPLVKPWLAQYDKTIVLEDFVPERGPEHREEGSPESPQEPAVHPAVVKVSGRNIFGRYLLEQKLGQGGMGEVYLASDPVLNRKVALKIITMEGAEPRERFLREARAVARLKHPNIVPVHEVGTINNYHYFTMDWIAGASLEDLAQEKPTSLTPRRAAEIISEIAGALQYAHAEGLIHRDIKPANILVDRSGRAYLTDFGLAKELTPSSRSLTLTGTIMGTPDYMSPEQARGDKKQIDQRSDIFSLGATFYHILTGQAPFQGAELYQILESVVHNDPFPPSRLSMNISRDLETICLKCLEKDKNHRYQTAGELAADLRRYLDGEGINARPIGFPTRIWRKAVKNKIASVAIAGIILILLVIGIVLTVKAAEAGRKLATYRREAQQLFDANKFEEAATTCKQILAIAPDDADAQSLLDDCELQIRKTSAQRRQAEAVLARMKSLPNLADKISAADEARRVDPTFAGEIYQELGYAYEENRKYPEALEAFTNAIKSDPRLPYAHYERACIQYVNKPDEALVDYKKVVELDPESYVGYIAEGMIEFRQGKHDAALADINKAIQLKPNEVSGYNERATIYIHTGKIDLAMADWDTIIKLDPGNVAIYTSRAYYHWLKGETDLAMSDINRALELDPQNAEGYNTRGCYYLEKQQLTSAINDFTRAIALQPNYLLPYENRSDAYKAKGDMESALADFNRAIELSPRNGVLYYKRGMVYLQKKNYTQAINDYSRSIELNPKSSAAYCYRGQSYYFMRQYDNALADYNKVIELDPKQSAGYNNRGLLYDDLHQTDLAIIDYSKSIEIAPTEANTYYNRGLAYAAKGDFARAITDGEMFLKLAPDHPQAAHLRTLVEIWRIKLPVSK